MAPASCTNAPGFPTAAGTALEEAAWAVRAASRASRACNAYEKEVNSASPRRFYDAGAGWLEAAWSDVTIHGNRWPGAIH
eukprot:3723392-Pleurochrysis_carterae.AAC.2